MSIRDSLKSFTTSAAAAVVVAGALTATEAQAQRREPIPYVGRNEPPSCRDYRREQSRVERGFEQGANRVVGSVLGGLLGRGGNTGTAIGGGAGYIAGGVVSNVQREARLKQLYNQCLSDIDYQAQGVCTNQVTQNSQARTVDGRLVGRSEGRVTETQRCEQSMVPYPQGGNMAGDLNGRTAAPVEGAAVRGSAGARSATPSSGEYDGSRRGGSARDRMSAATGASGETCSPVTIEGKGDALLCRGTDGKSRIVELAPAPRR